VSRIRWTEQAVGDVRAIRQYIERDSPRYGRLVAERLIEATARLQAFPQSGRIVPELNRDDVREIIVGAYRIVYRLEPQAVTVLTVFRSSRLLPTDTPGLN
jgi:addiction module RelE/StbE family toxin